MILGLLSDTHGHLGRTRRALSMLNAHHSDMLVHCGDLGSEAVLDLLFEERECGRPVIAVPGNVDEWDPDLPLYAQKLDFPFHRTQRFEAGEVRCAVFHGHDSRLMDQLTVDPELDLLFTGHTHVALDDTSGPVRVINPGAVYRAAVPSVAVLDTASGKLRLMPFLD